jgi:Lipoprotein amino terminal region
VKTATGDKYWSINIKKGLVSLFQLKLTGKSAPWSDTDSSSYADYSYVPSYGSQKSIKTKLFDSFNPFGSRRLSTPRLENAFKVMEVSYE